MKPFRIFIFFLAVLLILAAMALLIPEEGIGITRDLKLSFISLSSIFESGTPSGEVDVKALLAKSGVTDDPESDPTTGLFLPSDGINLIRQPVVIPANKDSLQRSVYRIRFAGENEALLDPFFHKLDGVASGEIRQTRILHFGDSQIENDRMTALLRYRLQKLFGGTGSGLVQAIPLYSGSMAYQQDQQGDWLRYTFFGKRDSTIGHNSYGIMGAFSSVPQPQEGYLPMLHYRFNRARQSGRCDRIRIYLHSYVDSAEVIFQVNNEWTDTMKYIPDGFSAVDFSYQTGISDVKILFNLPKGGRIYGISFESSRGIQVDNVAMRGGSGLIFTKMDRSQLTAMLDHLNPGMILLQYGGNVVPYIDPDYYQRAFKRELMFFRQVCPDVPVIVIGPSDMSEKENGIFMTYHSLEAVRDALKRAALESGCGFWDLYEAMGGHNSMPSFVHADPPLASTDYVHFTALGVNLVAEMFYNALMLEYNRYSTQNPVP